MYFVVVIYKDFYDNHLIEAFFFFFFAVRFMFPRSKSTTNLHINMNKCISSVCGLRTFWEDFTWKNSPSFIVVVVVTNQQEILPTFCLVHLFIYMFGINFCLNFVNHRQNDSETYVTTYFSLVWKMYYFFLSFLRSVEMLLVGIGLRKFSCEVIKRNCTLMLMSCGKFWHSFR